MAFIVYDTETSGTEEKYDQIFQFAAILADDQLRELDSFSLRCRRLPHIVPSPGAMLATGMRPRDLEEQPLSHYEMMGQIRARLQEWSRGGAVFLGYNSITFDEVLLREAYYQTLLPIYQTTTQGNSRADVMRIAQACSIHAPNSIAIPMGNKGRPSFRLGKIAAANGIDLVNAHEALSDARATLDLARLISQVSPEIWKAMLRNTRKQGVEAVLQKPFLCLSDVYFGLCYSFVVREAARNPRDQSDIGLFDLANDPEPYLGCSEHELLPLINGNRKVIRCVRPNFQPMLMPFDLAPAGVRGGMLPSEIYLRRAVRVREHDEFRVRLGAAMAMRLEERPKSPYLEDQVYDGFADDYDSQLMAAFHKADWPDRRKICLQIGDARFKELGLRIIHYHRPELLPADERAQFDAFIRDRLTTEDNVPWTTIPKAQKELTELRKSADRTTKLRLSEIEEYLNALGPSVVVGNRGTQK